MTPFLPTFKIHQPALMTHDKMERVAINLWCLWPVWLDPLWTDNSQYGGGPLSNTYHKIYGENYTNRNKLYHCCVIVTSSMINWKIQLNIIVHVTQLFYQIKMKPNIKSKSSDKSALSSSNSLFLFKLKYTNYSLV